MAQQTGREIANVNLTREDLTHNTMQAFLKAIPVIGESLNQFIYGAFADLRMKRMEQTLREIGEALRNGGRVDTEEFVNLLEKTLPIIPRAASERKRRFFRDLLINAAKNEPDSPRWADADLAADLISEIDPPGLAILAALGHCQQTRQYVEREPTPRVYDEENQTNAAGRFYEIGYGWPVVEEWVWRLKEKRLIGLGSAASGGGFGGVYLTALGRFVVEWGMVAGEPYQV
jgi:hypothetical protein